MVTDLAEVFRLGTAKAKENLAFRRYLSARHCPDQPFQILASEVQQHIDCRQCANCCREALVPVSAAEMERIAEYLGMTAEAAARLYTEPDPDEAGSRTLKNEGGCVFLDGTLCLIYEARPKTCREFPHVAIGEHSLGSRRASLGRWAARCPIVFNAMEEYKQRVGYRARSKPAGARGPSTLTRRV